MQTAPVAPEGKIGGVMRREQRIVSVIATAAAIASLAATLSGSALGQVAKAPGRDDDRAFARFEPRAATPEEIALEHLASGRRELQRAEKLSRRAPGARDSRKTAIEIRANAAYSRAAAEFGMAVQLDPDAVSAHAGLGRALAGLGRHGEALATFAGGLNLAPEDDELLRGWAVSLLALGRADEAIAAHATLTETRPEQAEALLAALAAWLAEQLERPSSATESTVLKLGEWLPDHSG
jgi:tetratricopeptide (TPR) repeat protein